MIKKIAIIIILLLNQSLTLAHESPKTEPYFEIYRVTFETQEKAKYHPKSFSVLSKKLRSLKKQTDNLAICSRNLLKIEIHENSKVDSWEICAVKKSDYQKSILNLYNEIISQDQNIK